MKQQLLFALKFLTLTGAYLFTRSRTPPRKLKNPGKAIAVLFVLENLKRALVCNANLIRGAKTQVEILENDIRLFKAFLRDCARISDRDAALEDLVDRVQVVVREGENIIAAFAKHQREIRVSNFAQRAFCGPVKLIGIAKDVKAVREKVKRIYDGSRNISAYRRIGRGAIEDATAGGGGGRHSRVENRN